MFEEDKYTESDILMGSILSEAEEEVPSHIWENISSELDRIEGVRAVKPVRLWFRRSAIAVAAAAAIVAGIFADWNGEADTDLVSSPYRKGMIAVVGHDINLIDAVLPEVSALNDMKLRTITADAGKEVAQAMEVVTMEMNDEKVQAAPAKETERKQEKTATSEQVYFPDIWPEDEAPARKKRASFVVSGLAGSNGTQSNPTGVLKRPTMSTARPVTGVVQKSSESTYGLPVSFGAGIRFEVAPDWSVGTGLNYSLLVRKFFGTYTLVDGQGNVEHSVTSDVRNMQRYLGIPVNIFYDILDNDHINFHAYAGGTVEKCFSDTYDILSTDFIHKQKANGVQLSANAGVGVEFMFGYHLGLYIDPSIRYYFKSKQPNSIRTAQPLMFGIEAGLRFKI